MQVSPKKTKGLKWYNLVAEPEVLAIEPELTCFYIGITEKPKPRYFGVLKEFLVQWCLVLNG